MEAFKFLITGLLALAIIYLMLVLLIKAYFAARREHIFQLLDKVKEISSGKKQG